MNRWGVLVLTLFLGGCAANDGLPGEPSIENATDDAQASEMQSTESVGSVCSQVTEAVTAAADSFQEGLADGDYKASETLDFSLKLESLVSIYVDNQTEIDEDVNLEPLVELFSEARALVNKIDDKTFDFFETQNVLNSGLETFSSTCSESPSQTETERFFSMNYGKGVYRLELPTEPSEHISTRICEFVASQVDFEVQYYREPRLESYPKGKSTFSSCSFYGSSMDRADYDLRIIEYSSDSFQEQNSREFVEFIQADGFDGQITQTYRLENVDITQSGTVQMPPTFFEQFGFELIPLESILPPAAG